MEKFTVYKVLEPTGLGQVLEPVWEGHYDVLQKIFDCVREGNTVQIIKNEHGILYSITIHNDAALKEKIGGIISAITGIVTFKM